MVADDMGWSDLGCYGGVAYTPNLDGLAEKGIRFTDFYAAAPNCSPSRAGLLTGKSPAILGMYNYRPPGHPIHLRDEEVTLAEVLQTDGYRTGHFGKWHLGCLPQDSLLNHPQPRDQGFQYSLGTENNAQPSHLNPVNFIRNGEPVPDLEGYSCQIVAGEAMNWLESQAGSEQPFFAYVAFHEPHKKVASPPELVSKYSQHPTADAEYLANVENMDLAVGRIIEYLEGMDQLDNTLIIFSSDNGSYRQASNGPLRAVKSYVYEGGIRVPGIIHWPGLSTSERVISEPAGFVDIMPTICDLLNITPPNAQELDGTSFYDLLNGQELSRRKPLYWYFYRTSPEIAMRIEDHMILGKDVDTIPKTHRFARPDMAYIREMTLDTYEVYDLTSDQGQYNDIADSHPESVDLQQMVNEKLLEIQERGHYWEHLPEASGSARVKTEWVKYDRRIDQ